MGSEPGRGRGGLQHQGAVRPQHAEARPQGGRRRWQISLMQARTQTFQNYRYHKCTYTNIFCENQKPCYNNKKTNFVWFQVRNADNLV